MPEKATPAKAMTERPPESGPQTPSRRPPQRLARRAEFLAAAKGQRFQSRSFSLQATVRKNPCVADPASGLEGGPAAEVRLGAARFGFTVTKKIGNAFLRNRIRRRLKEALRLASDLPARPGHDYVIVARNNALSQSFAALQDELRRALAGLGGASGASRGKGRARFETPRTTASAQSLPRKDLKPQGLTPQEIGNGAADT